MDNGFKQMLERYRHQIAQGLSREQVIANLRLEGISILEASKLFKSLYGGTLREATRELLQHPSWVDEAHKVMTLQDIVEVIAADPLYASWLDWYTMGVQRLGMLQLSSITQEQQRAIEERFRRVAQAEQATQGKFIEELAPNLAESIDVATQIVSNYSHYAPEMVAVAAQVLYAFHIRSDGTLIRWLILLTTDSGAPGRFEAIQLLKEMDKAMVIPYFLAVFLNDHEDQSRWKEMVHATCQVLMEHTPWITACGPALTHLLSRIREQEENQPDPAILLSALERIIPQCSYAIPAIYQLALRAKESELGQQAQRLLLLFDEADVKLYRYHIQWLLGDSHGHHERAPGI